MYYYVYSSVFSWVLSLLRSFHFRKLLDFRSSGKINNSCENGEYSQAGELAETVVVSKNETGQHLPAQ